jgi:hypothetical protein
LQGDLKEVIGALMRVLDGQKISRGEVEDLAFEADGELQIALNEAYIRLLELAYDCDAGLDNQTLSAEMRAALQQSLDEIIRCSEQLLSRGHEASDRES